MQKRNRIIVYESRFVLPPHRAGRWRLQLSQNLRGVLDRQNWARKHRFGALGLGNGFNSPCHRGLRQHNNIHNFAQLGDLFADDFVVSGRIAARDGVDYNELRELWLLDPRIGRSHTWVHPGDRGFGGRCLPKDLQAIVAHAQHRGEPAILLDAVLRSNERVRPTSNDSK